MAHTICHFEIPADDPEALKGFYEKLFGWTIEKFPGPMEYWMIDTGGEPGGGMMARQMPEQMPVNYVLVESVDEYAKNAEHLGGQVVVPKTAVGDMGWFAMLVDPQGNPVGIFEEAGEG